MHHPILGFTTCWPGALLSGPGPSRYRLAILSPAGSAPRPPADASGSPVSISIPARLARQKACLQRSGFDWRPPPSSNSSTWQVMSVPETQLSPSGFQRRTSWVIGSRQTRFGRLPANTAWGDTELPPQSVFVRTDLLQAFFHRVLPCISNPLVLLVGDHDATTPRQVGLKSRAPSARMLMRLSSRKGAISSMQSCGCAPLACRLALH